MATFYRDYFRPKSPDPYQSFSQDLVRLAGNARGGDDIPTSFFGGKSKTYGPQRPIVVEPRSRCRNSLQGRPCWETNASDIQLRNLDSSLRGLFASRRSRFLSRRNQDPYLAWGLFFVGLERQLTAVVMCNGKDDYERICKALKGSNGMDDYPQVQIAVTIGSPWSSIPIAQLANSPRFGPWMDGTSDLSELEVYVSIDSVVGSLINVPAKIWISSPGSSRRPAVMGTLLETPHNNELFGLTVAHATTSLPFSLDASSDPTHGLVKIGNIAHTSQADYGVDHDWALIRLSPDFRYQEQHRSPHSIGPMPNEETGVYLLHPSGNIKGNLMASTISFDARDQGQGVMTRAVRTDQPLSKQNQIPPLILTL